MAGSFEKSVKGATKIKLAAPKSKYVEHILVATHAGEAGVAEVFRVLQNRLRDATWTIVFKSLIIVHFMVREGEADVTLRYLVAHQPQRKLAINHFTEVQTQGRNIRHYAEYLTQRALSYGSTKLDYVRSGEGRLKRLSVDKGLLRETESVQKVIEALVRCDFFSAEAENDITLTALRLLTSDLLALFHAMNEGMINVLEHYFELSRPDAERSLSIYRNFVELTKRSISYFSMARQYELSTGVNVPKIKHAPTTLAASLEEYLNDPDFEANRRRYIAEQEFKKNAKNPSATPNRFATTEPKQTPSQTNSSASARPVQAPAVTQPTKGPAPDLIDFFESIDQNPVQYQQAPVQQAVYTQQQPYPMQMQPTGFNPQQSFVGQGTNPFGQPQQIQQLQQTPTGAGFGGYTPQQASFMPQTPLTTIPQNGVANFAQQQQQQQPDMYGNQQQQAQSTNPFRQSMLPNLVSPPSTPFTNGAPRSGTNPFAKPNPASAPSYATPLQSPAPLQPTPTGTNPFARNTNNNSPATPATPGGLAPPPAAAPLAPHVTGSTNPFRQSAFVNQATGQGWQNSSQGTLGGLEHLETIPVFPRPGQ